MFILFTLIVNFIELKTVIISEVNFVTKSNVKSVFKEEFKDDPIGINSLNYKLLGLGKFFCT